MRFVSRVKFSREQSNQVQRPNVGRPLFLEVDLLSWTSEFVEIGIGQILVLDLELRVCYLPMFFVVAEWKMGLLRVQNQYKSINESLSYLHGANRDKHSWVLSHEKDTNRNTNHQD